MARPQLSVVLLTLNEAANIGPCLRSLARQSCRGFEVIVIDSASADRTVDVVRRLRRGYPVPLRLSASRRHLDIGEARNRGVALARASRVAFLSADVEVDRRWVEEALRCLETHDMVFGRQVHAPRTPSTAAAVRGLRYRFPRALSADPLPYASNVCAAYRKDVLRRHPFDPWANAAEDLVLVRQAMLDGATALYNPHMVVHHHDVETARGEWRKNVREGRGWGVYSRELGLHLPVLAWAAGLVAAFLLLLMPLPTWPVGIGWRLLAFPVLLWMPAVRRAARNLGQAPLDRLLVGVAATPVFDLAFLGCYVAALWRPRPMKRGWQEPEPQ